MVLFLLIYETIVVCKRSVIFGTFLVFQEAEVYLGGGHKVSTRVGGKRLQRELQFC